MHKQVTNLVLQPYRVVPVCYPAQYSTLATAATGGVLLSCIPDTPGAGACPTLPAVYSGPAIVVNWGILFDV
jgi:hypothetical protein